MFDLPRQPAAGPRSLTVSQLTALIKDSLQTAFDDVYVVGEVSQVTRAASGHVYLNLKDEGAVLRAVIWRNVAAGLRFEVRDGVELLAHGAVDVYAPRGTYQLVVDWLEPRGVGARELAFRQLVEKLEREGLFRPELKRPLPRFPRRIGLVTSPTGAAVRDVINVISRRFPAVEVYLHPVRVQGDGAAAEIAAAIERLNRRRPDLDVLIVGRGGGSIEDLWAFNEEAVARAIRASRIPVISAVGHEVDVTISDLVADVRAATPTEAGEIVVPDREELLAGLGQIRLRLTAALSNAAARACRRLEALASRPAFVHPEAPLRERSQRLDDMMERMHMRARHGLAMLREQLAGTGQRLDALSPLKVLGRGYSLTYGPDGRLLRDAAEVRPGDRIATQLARGVVRSQVLETENP